MNEVIVSGQILNVPRYDIIPSTADTLARLLLKVDNTVLPVICCNDLAYRTRQLLYDISGTKEQLYVSGSLKGCPYTDAVGSHHYLVYMVADRIARSKEGLQQQQPTMGDLAYKYLPFSVADLEDILMYGRKGDGIC